MRQLATTADLYGTDLSSRHSEELPNQLHAAWSLLRRHWQIVAAALAITIALGTLYYLKAPREFESVTDILIKTERFSGFNSNQEIPVLEKSIETHSALIASHKILDRAIREHNLDTLSCFDDEPSVRDAILDALNVQLKEENTSILSVSFRCSNPKESKVVVEAIAGTYENFLGESNQRAGDNAANLITEANTKLSRQIDDLDQQIRRFQSKAPLMWRDDGEAVNRHHERQIQIELARQNKMVERTELRARLDAISKSLEDGTTSREALYYEALGELRPDTDSSNTEAMRLAEQEQMAQRVAVREMSSLLMGEYVKLLVGRSDLIDEYGEGHPRLESNKKQTKKVTALLGQLVENKMPLSGSILSPEDVEKDRKDYVTIYIQLLRDRLESLDTQIAQLDEEFKSEQVEAGAMQDYLVVDKALRTKKQRKQQLYEAVVGRLNEINVVADYGGETITVITPAELGEQVSPRLLHVAVGSLFLGSILGLGLAWLADANEKIFHNASEIRSALGTPVVGCIPIIPKREMRNVAPFSNVDSSICSIHRERSPVAEAIRGIRTNLYFSAAGRNLKVFQVTSPLPGDGKSTLTANLAVTIASSGKRVLVVDCDFHKPKLTRLFGKAKDCKHGLAAVITGKVPVSEAVIPTDVPNLFLLAAHERPVNPSELLTTRDFEDLLNRLRDEYDFVLIDTPPVLAVTDPCAVAPRVDGVLMTFRIRKGVQATAQRCVDLLQDVGANILGVVVNGVDQKKGQSEVGEYGYTYSMYPGYSDNPLNQKKASNGSAAPKVSEQTVKQ